MKKIVSFSIDEDLDKQLDKVAEIIGNRSEVVEKALRQLFADPEFNRAVHNIERVLNENPEAKAK